MATRNTFKVDREKYPIFSRQSSLAMKGSDTYQLGIDETLAAYVSDTAGLIAEFDGTSTASESDAGYIVPDHVVYLDKSGRPCSWFVSAFWKIFAKPDTKVPAHSYLNIDRRDWIRRSGADLLPTDYVLAADGSNHRLDYNDFHTENITREHLAWIRAQYIPGGIESEDVECIMGSPTILDGKNICVVDEVASTGTTLKIAQWLLSNAFPGSTVRGLHFWKKLSGVKPVATDDGQMLNAPVWYDHNNQYGRGIGNVDLDGSFWAAEYEKNPTPQNLARKFGAQTLSRKIDLSPGGEDDRGTDRPTRELIREIKLMRDDFRAGRILFQPPSCYSTERKKRAIEAQGLKLGRSDDPDTFARVCEDISADRQRL